MKKIGLLLAIMSVAILSQGAMARELVKGYVPFGRISRFDPARTVYAQAAPNPLAMEQPARQMLMAKRPLQMSARTAETVKWRTRNVTRPMEITGNAVRMRAVRGDNLSHMRRDIYDGKTGVSLDDIAKASSLGNKDVIHVGQWITFPFSGDMKPWIKNMIERVRTSGLELEKKQTEVERLSRTLKEKETFMAEAENKFKQVQAELLAKTDIAVEMEKAKKELQSRLDAATASKEALKGSLGTAKASSAAAFALFGLTALGLLFAANNHRKIKKDVSDIHALFPFLFPSENDHIMRITNKRNGMREQYLVKTKLINGQCDISPLKSREGMSRFDNFDLAKDIVSRAIHEGSPEVSGLEIYMADWGNRAVSRLNKKQPGKTRYGQSLNV